TMRGQPKLEWTSIQPASTGGNAAASERGTFVTLAAAARSSGGTTAITYDCRAGTSMFETHMRRRRHATAAAAFGITPATMSRRRVGGRCVYPIVSMRPMRAASRDETSCENAAHRLATKKICPAVATDKPNRLYNQSTSNDWTMKPPPIESSENSAASLMTMA